MGSVSLKIGDGTARFKRSTLFSSAINLLMLFSIVTTNLFALYAFSSRSQSHTPHPLHSNNVSLVSQHLSLILREIDSSHHTLTQMEKQIIGYESLDLSQQEVPQELKLFLQQHQLPLGKDSRTGITQMVASVGHSCEMSLDLLSQYMSYNVFEKCPDDWSLAQKLILRACEPLPRRRCLAKTVHKPGLALFPDSLWRPVGNSSVNWSGLGCKSFECLKGDGKIRIGFDISSGSGTFAARMAEKNVNIISNTLNIDAPFSEFIAARGIFPLFMSFDQRLPFYDNVFDLIHASNGLDLAVSNKPEKLEFLMFDLDRILKPGGLFWLDNFYCGNDEKKRVLTRLIERFGYKKLKWVVGEKTDAEVFLSAVLQKPARI
ncbi:putative S-adenosyl-L-methionine-dependent methyltransferase [Arabidopsis thaliana]